jgi:hypothetical protein
MTRPVLLQILLGAALVAAGVAAAFTQTGDTWRLGGAVIATMGVITARRAIRGLRRGPKTPLS